MCGIYCAFDLQESKVDLRPLKERGPDSSSLLYHRRATVGFTRLAINDIKGGDQPFERAEHISVCNGEIYNHVQLKEEYTLDCVSQSDCECIAPLTVKLGPLAAYHALDGVFAYVIITQDTIFFARDYIGVRPLYIGRHRQYDTPVVASLATMLDHCECVEQVPPGLYRYDQGVVTNLRAHLPFVHLRDPVHQLRSTLFRAVEKRLMSDRPIGCLLSGGLDSSIIAAILCTFLGAENVRTYSIGMEGSTDLKAAQIVADHLGTQHTSVTFTPEEGIEIIPEVIRILETYDVTTVRASVGMYLLAQYIKGSSNDKVIFSGEGSDEMFCGYLYFHNAPRPIDAALESHELQANLYKYDVLRADRCIASCGLELRVPFLDRDMLNLVRNLSPRQLVPRDGWEKFLLRTAFKDLLPSEIAWRRKEGFSDGTGTLDKPFHAHIHEYLQGSVLEEERYYRTHFNLNFPYYQPVIPRWMPKWTDTEDPSGRVIMTALDHPLETGTY